eukprot:scaffold250_cov204-Ochromonas_danica.AAC.1
MSNIYGMKQASELWYAHLASKLIEFGLVRLANDVCTFTHSNQSEAECLIVTIYVDDILILELDIKRDENYIYLTQKDYCEDIVESYVPDHIKAISTPLSSYSAFDTSQGNESPIQVQVGKLRYLADRTRSDILVSTGLLGSIAAKPNQTHLLKLQRVLKYLKGTCDTRLKLGGKEDVKITSFVDSNHNLEGDFKDTFGYAIYLNSRSGAIIIKSKKSTLISTSTAQSEIRAIVEIIKEVNWLLNFLNELSINYSLPILIYTDSQVAIDATAKPINRPKSKHFARDIAFVREAREGGVIELKFVKSEDNVADILTKPLNEVQHRKFTYMLLYGYEEALITSP